MVVLFLVVFFRHLSGDVARNVSTPSPRHNLDQTQALYFTISDLLDQGVGFGDITPTTNWPTGGRGPNGPRSRHHRRRRPALAIFRGQEPHRQPRRRARGRAPARVIPPGSQLLVRTDNRHGPAIRLGGGQVESRPGPCVGSTDPGLDRLVRHRRGRHVPVTKRLAASRSTVTGPPSLRVRVPAPGKRVKHRAATRDGNNRMPGQPVHRETSLVHMSSCVATFLRPPADGGPRDRTHSRRYTRCHSDPPCHR